MRRNVSRTLSPTTECALSDSNSKVEAIESLQAALQTYWGYDSFRPLQVEAMQCALAGRDSVTVLPTGGGKSLCFQAPAVCLPGLAVVVSPLISLMKDQVDALNSCGVPAACLNSGLSHEEQEAVVQGACQGRIKLLYLAPERLVTQRTLDLLQSIDVSLVAIDEAHCISAWGHDFRPEFRQLSRLKEVLPGIGIHAYTATATEAVRRDIAEQLRLDVPEILVGSFDRPNLNYAVQRQNGVMQQIRTVLETHPGESGIIYCISRDRVEQVSATLNEAGFRTLPYHAGLADAQRHRNQEAFIREEVDTIVATVAFGMGIDKSNVRYVIHAGMPKSLEHYQQESGRAGRDGLEADCVLLFSGADYNLWKRMLEDSHDEALEGALRSLAAMYDYATGVVCRHQAIVAHFGQQAPDRCDDACDVCQGKLNLVDDPLIVGQKILSSVLRQGERFGGDYTSMVLHGSHDKRILDNQHDHLSTWGLLRDHDKATIRDWVEQLVGQGCLEKVGEYNVLRVTTEGRRLLRGELTPRLLKPASRRSSQSARRSKSGAGDSWEGVDRQLFNALKALRTEEAKSHGVPAYIIFGDAALRDMARRRPSTLTEFLNVRGVGDKKCRDFGEQFIACIVDYCQQHELATDVQ